MGQVNVDLKDKTDILLWLEKHCNGFRNARTRENVLPFVLIHKNFNSDEAKDRYFRRAIHALIHEGHVCSHNSRGYWFKPLFTRDPAEIEAIKESLLERKAKGLAMISDCDKQLKWVEEAERVITQGQMTLSGV